MMLMVLMVLLVHVLVHWRMVNWLLLNVNTISFFISSIWFGSVSVQ